MSKHTSHQQSIHPGGMMDLDCHFLLAVLINAQHPGQKCDHGSFSHPLRPPQGALAHLGPSFIFSPPELARKAEGHLTLIPPQKRPLREALHLPQVHHTGWWEDPCPPPSSRSHVLSKHFLWCPGRHCVVYSIEMLSYPSTPRANILPKKGMMSDLLREPTQPTNIVLPSLVPGKLWNLSEKKGEQKSALTTVLKSCAKHWHQSLLFRAND